MGESLREIDVRKIIRKRQIGVNKISRKKIQKQRDGRYLIKEIQESFDRK